MCLVQPKMADRRPVEAGMAPGQPVEAGRVPGVSRSQTGRLEREDESTKRDCGTISGESLQRAKALSGGRKLAKVVPGKRGI